MSIDDEAERAVGAALSQYCASFDDARFAEFAALFERGRWFMVAEPGPRPVREWIDRQVILYGDSPRTRHVVSEVEVGHRPGEEQATFTCRIVITQQLPGAAEHLLARARFTGTFHLEDRRWWWRDHAMHPEETGDLSTHIRGGGPT